MYQKAVAIYKNDGQSLENWIDENLNNSATGGRVEPKDEASVATYREQFKNMLALDIWIDKLLQWQLNGYKLEMPVKEPVDPMNWNKILKAKFLRIMQEDNPMHTPPPKADASSRTNMTNTDASRSLENQRKRMHNSAMPGNDGYHDSDKYRTVKAKKLHEGYPESKHENALSTDPNSEISLAIRHQAQKPIRRPPVSMTELFKNITKLKNEIKMSIHDEENK